MYKCPYCGSARLFRYQRDSDYSGGAFYNPLNETELGIYLIWMARHLRTLTFVTVWTA